MKKIFLKMLTCVLLICILLVFSSCSESDRGGTTDGTSITSNETSAVTSEAPKKPSAEELYGKAVVEFEGNFIDISSLPKSSAIAPCYNFYPQSFSEIEDHVKNANNGCIVKFKVADIATQKLVDPFQGLCVPIVIDEIFYQAEGFNLSVGQELELTTRMYFISRDPIDKTPVLLREDNKGSGFFVGGEYLLIGYYDPEEIKIWPCVSYRGVIEITSFSDTNGFDCDPMGFKEEAFKKYGISPK